jgi:hypothetical protein
MLEDARNIRTYIHIPRSVKVSREFIKATENPLKSPDLNPLEYCIWANLDS